MPRKFKVQVSKGTLRVWSAYIEVEAKNIDEAEEKAQKLAEEYPEGNTDGVVWDEDGDINQMTNSEEQPYNFQVEDTQQLESAYLSDGNSMDGYCPKTEDHKHEDILGAGGTLVCEVCGAKVETLADGRPLPKWAK